jgi:hypothetical protein
LGVEGVYALWADDGRGFSGSEGEWNEGKLRVLEMPDNLRICAGGASGADADVMNMDFGFLRSASRVGCDPNSSSRTSRLVVELSLLDGGSPFARARQVEVIEFREGARTAEFTRVYEELSSMLSPSYGSARS